MPVEIFFSYAHEDEALVDHVRRHLMSFERLGLIRTWYDRDISPGTLWETEIEARLRAADIILLFISADFFASDYAHDREMTVALRRFRAGEAQVIPIILRYCPWRMAPFNDLQVLPKDATPIAAWEDRDKACMSVAEGIMRVVERISGAATEALPSDGGPAGAENASLPPGPSSLSRPEPSVVIHLDDPQKERWGGQRERNGRKLWAQVSHTNKLWFRINLLVSSTDGSALQGPVFFHLHDTYPQSVIRITRIREPATAVLEEVEGIGTFTVGVQVKDRDGRWVGLELDLSELPELGAYVED